MNFELKNLNWIDDLVPGLIIQGKQKANRGKNSIKNIPNTKHDCKGGDAFPDASIHQNH